MAGQTVILHSLSQRAYARSLIERAPEGAVVNVREAETDRTLAQNRLIHRWFADISRALVGVSPADVKADCNLKYGRPILLRDDPEWQAVFDYLFRTVNDEAKKKAIRVLDVPFTRRMTVKQLTEYMNQMQQDYAEAGISLTDPDARKYEGAG